MEDAIIQTYKDEISNNDSIDALTDINFDLNKRFAEQRQDLTSHNSQTSRINIQKTMADIKTLLSLCHGRIVFLNQPVTAIRDHRFRHLAKILLSKDQYKMLSTACQKKFKDGEVEVNKFIG